MKYSFLFFSHLLVLSLLCMPLHAQIGVKAGAGVSDIAFLDEGQIPFLGYEVNSLEHRVPMAAFQMGIFYTFPLGNRFDIQAELLFARQGLDYGTKFLYDDITYKIRIDYLKVPALLKYKTSVKKGGESALFIGPYFSTKLQAKKVTEIDGDRVISKSPNVNALDFGAVFGYSTDIHLFRNQIILDWRASYSLLNMMTPLEGQIPRYLGPSRNYARLVNITMTVGYQF